ncbi:MAG: glycosyltransferase family 4 protein [Acidimicrobiales bacterium]
MVVANPPLEIAGIPAVEAADQMETGAAGGEMAGTADRSGNGVAVEREIEVPGSESIFRSVENARLAGVSCVEIIAWRDIDDPEAGGSEMHAHRVASEWADAGLDVVMRTSRARGCAELEWRNGYRVVRRSGRYGVFPKVFLELFTGMRYPTRADALVEIWNGMPFLGPLATRKPHITVLHHVHDRMWNMVLPPALAWMGRIMELKLAPKAYRSSRIVTLSESSRDEIVSMLGIPERNIRVVPPGVDPGFAPGSAKAPYPLVIAVGRLVPVKQLGQLIETLVAVKREVPGLRAVIAGEGYERSRLEGLRRAHGADGWLEMPGRLSEATLVDLYRSAWVVVSASSREGWGMTVTEAGACGTPAVVTDIAGHSDAVIHGVSGLLVPVGESMPQAVERVLKDEVLRETLSAGALKYAQALSWKATATAILDELVAAAKLANR